MSRISALAMVLVSLILLCPSVGEASTESCAARCSCQKECWNVRDSCIRGGVSKNTYNQCGQALWACLAICQKNNFCSPGDKLNVHCSLPRL